MRKATKPDGEQYYEYILTHVDDLLSGSHNGKGPLQELQRLFKFKNNTIESPDTYLGAKLSTKKLGEREIDELEMDENG